LSFINLRCTVHDALQQTSTSTRDLKAHRRIAHSSSRAEFRFCAITHAKNRMWGHCTLLVAMSQRDTENFCSQLTAHASAQTSSAPSFKQAVSTNCPREQRILKREQKAPRRISSTHDLKAHKLSTLRGLEAHTKDLRTFFAQCCEVD